MGQPYLLRSLLLGGFYKKGLKRNPVMSKTIRVQELLPFSLSAIPAAPSRHMASFSCASFGAQANATEHVLVGGQRSGFSNRAKRGEHTRPQVALRLCGARAEQS